MNLFQNQLQDRNKVIIMKIFPSCIGPPPKAAIPKRDIQRSLKAQRSRLSEDMPENALEEPEIEQVQRLQSIDEMRRQIRVELPTGQPTADIAGAKIGLAIEPARRQRCVANNDLVCVQEHRQEPRLPRRDLEPGERGRAQRLRQNRELVVADKPGVFVVPQYRRLEAVRQMGSHLVLDACNETERETETVVKTESSTQGRTGLYRMSWRIGGGRC